MFRTLFVWSQIKYSILGAIVYCIPAFLFIQHATYTDAWLLYLGNGLFLCAISLFMFSYNKKRKENASTTSMLVAGHATTVIGIILACFISFLVLIILVPGLFQSGTTGKVLTDAPVNTIDDKTKGLNFMVFFNAIVGNVSTGSFASIIFAFTLKRDQTKESATRPNKETKGV